MLHNSVLIHSFFYKSTLYKNTEARFAQKIRTSLGKNHLVLMKQMLFWRGLTNLKQNPTRGRRGKRIGNFFRRHKMYGLSSYA